MLQAPGGLAERWGRGRMQVKSRDLPGFPTANASMLGGRYLTYTDEVYLILEVLVGR